MGHTLHVVTGADYEAVAAVLDAVEPDARASGEDLRRSDQSIRDGGLVSERVLARIKGSPIGYGVYGHMDWCADPAVWVALIKVIPSHRRLGVGTSLHRHIEAVAARNHVGRLFVEIREDDPSGPAFANRLGYRRIGVEFESWLDLTSVGPVDGVAEKQTHGGLAIDTLAGLRDATPDWFVQLHTLYSEIEGDIPAPFPTRPVPTATFRARHVDAPNVIPEAVFIARDGDRWVGLTELMGIEREPTWLQQELTGVVRSHRRRGLATVLKRIALEWARSNGFERIRTSNSSLNEGMLAVNARLGFIRGTPHGMWVRYR